MITRRAHATVLLIALLTASATTQERPSPSQLDELRKYIKTSWTTLTRTMKDLPAAAHDPKLPRSPGQPWPVYVSAKEDREQRARELRATLSEREVAEIDLKVLPADPLTIREHGLLYLPNPYVVPGGRFNEMYGWDSYFILVGLLRDGEIRRAQDMVQNFLYEIDQYGTILNANRTYFLTRSQPPFLTRMILGVFEATKDKDWLRSTLPAIDQYYRFWTTAPHLIDESGLSRYFDRGEGPAPEVVSDEKDSAGRTHYDRAREYYRTHEIKDYDARLFYDRAKDQLTDLFYKGDRSMRESGFDPSSRFGPFSVDIIHYAPVCLNSLLYQMEVDGATIAKLLGNDAAEGQWRDRARARQERVNRLLWDEKAGLYFDYNVRTHQRRPYQFATTFYPLWVGLATGEQARRVRANLSKFEAPGGLLTSTEVTGNQWDAPFGWAPLQMIAVEGLRRYGYDEDADRLATKFVALVTKEFQEHGTIVEKYDVRRRESDVEAGIKFGYAANQVGFGWTNGVVLELLAHMQEVVKR
ncbi:MAG TPA: trehalase family glycosidase [Vicinamibacterales bacterium]|jgi:alpha,alpha-trehalase|nr:trehalase family glycosidase [Vicinamibacterales bacterium]